MLLSRSAHAQLRSKILAEGVKEVVAELLLVDVIDFITYIHSEQFANIQDIVNSSIELFFKPGTLSYGWGAEVELDWGKMPAVILDMEFRHQSVWVIFKLTLLAGRTNVAIQHISFAKASVCAEQDTRMLIEAVADARLPKTEVNP
jgi:hypothetical protein